MFNREQKNEIKINENKRNHNNVNVDYLSVKLDTEQLESIFATTDCGMMRHTVDGRVISINNAALRILGYETMEEMLQDGFSMIADSVYEDDREILKDSIRSLEKPGDSTSVNYRVYHKNGELIDVAGRIKLLEENGEIIYQRFLLDVTDYKEKERMQKKETENHHNDIVQALSIDFSSVYFMNLDTGKGYSYRTNDYLRAKFGDAFTGELGFKESMDMYREKVVFEEDRELYAEMTAVSHIINELTRKPAYYFNYRLRRNGKVEYFQLKIVRVGDWSKEHCIVMGFRSVDDETRREIEQKRALSDALEQAKHASQAKTVFLSNMSNDIRTPMNDIIGYSRMAYDKADEKESVKEYLENIMSSATHLLTFINDVLDMSNIESGKVKLAETENNLDDVVDEAISVLLDKIKEKNIDFIVDMSDIRNKSVICDKLRLNRILLNCLGNAVKFTDNGGRVELRISQQENAPEGFAGYVFRIKDNGIGMSSEFVSHIFEPFEKENNSMAGSNQGTGLGMAITKNIVDMMNGTISLESEQGVGSEFTISLCFRIAYEYRYGEDNENEETNKIPFRGRNILLVEDMELNREIAEIVLNEAGFKVDSVCNGKEAVERMDSADEDEYDIILMDVQMPVMDGYEASRRIRKLNNARKSSIPIIAMTANAFDEDRYNSTTAGMNDHLTKPIQINELYYALRRYIK
jgi:PAS domain S-box-containing protein